MAKRIDAALRQGARQAYLASKFGVTQSALSRHAKHHLDAPSSPSRPAPAAAAALSEDQPFALETPDDVLNAMRFVIRRVWRMVDKAEADGDLSTAIRAVTVAEKNLEGFWAKWSKLIEEKPRLINPVVNVFEGVPTETLVALRDALREERIARATPLPSGLGPHL